MTLVIKIPSEDYVIFAVDRKVTKGERYFKRIKINNQHNIIYSFSGTVSEKNNQINHIKNLKDYLNKCIECELTEAFEKTPFNTETREKVFINYAGFIKGKLTSGIYSVKDKKILDKDCVFNPGEGEDDYRFKILKDEGKKLFGNFNWDETNENILMTINKLTKEEKIELINKIYCSLVNWDTEMIGFEIDIWIVDKTKTIDKYECKCTGEEKFSESIIMKIDEDKIIENNINQAENKLNNLGIEHYDLNVKKIEVVSYENRYCVKLPVLKDENFQFKYKITLSCNEKSIEGFNIIYKEIIGNECIFIYQQKEKVEESLLF